MRGEGSVEQQLRWSNWAFAATFALLVLLGGWWIVLIFQLLEENTALRILVQGDTPELQLEHHRRRVMLAGESTLLSILAVSLVGLAYRYAIAERGQIRRLEGVLAASTHELKTPVAGVRALLESLESGVLPPERMAPHIGRGLESLSRLEHLIEGVLAYQSAVARERVSVVVRPLEDWVEEFLTHREGEGGDDHLTVELGAGGAEAVCAERDAFRVVLDNLLDNAHKYGRGAPVVLRTRVEGNFVHLEVVDGGEGFQPEEGLTLFEPYQRGSAGQRRHGTGLGLYIGRTLARAMGGELGATSPGPGQGATFTLTRRRAAG